MGQISDGSAVCDRCGISLPAFGVMHGMCAATREGNDLIFCYVNSCWEVVTYGLINFTGPDVCANDGSPVVWSTGAAILTADTALDPDVVRRMAFCYENGCATQFLFQIGNL